MSEIINKRLSESKGKVIKVFVSNGFKFEGKLTGFDDVYLEIYDFKIKGYKLIQICKITDLEVRQ